MKCSAIIKTRVHKCFEVRHCFRCGILPELENQISLK